MIVKKLFLFENSFFDVILIIVFICFCYFCFFRNIFYILNYFKNNLKKVFTL